MAVETKRRVKVYSFGEKLQWEDMGTGQISMDYVERNQVLTIIVRSEVDGKSVSSQAYSNYQVVWSIYYDIEQGLSQGDPCPPCSPPPPQPPNPPNPLAVDKLPSRVCI